MIPDETGGYWVEVPSLPGCFSQGETEEEALTNITEAIELHVEDMLAHGEVVPADVPAPILLKAVEYSLIETARIIRENLQVTTPHIRLGHAYGEVAPNNPSSPFSGSGIPFFVSGLRWHN